MNPQPGTAALREPAAWGRWAEIAETTEPAPAGGLDFEIAGERSWSEIHSGTDPFTFINLNS